MTVEPYPEHCAVRGKAGRLPGQVARYGDPLKHLGPTMGIPVWSKLWGTRCGLPGGDEWYEMTHDDDVWCPGCLAQAGIPHTVEDI